MSSKSLLLFLSIFLLAQSSLGKAVPSAVESKLTVENIPSEKPRNKLLFYVLTEFAQLADSTLATGKKLFQDVIAEVSAMKNKNEQITAKLEEYSNFVNKIEKLQTQTTDDSDEFADKFGFMVELSDLVDNSNVTLIEKPSNTDKLFADSLKKNGLSDLEQEFEEKFEAFAKDFNTTADRILNSATVQEWPQKPKIEDWLKDFRAEHDVEKKIVMFEKFFNFFE